MADEVLDSILAEEAAGAVPDVYPLITGPRPQFGKGREEIAGGGFYEGSFRFGLRCGRGTLVLNGEGTERYEGEFRAEHHEGAGRKAWADGTVYDGQWLQGRKNGEGVLEEPSGRRYSGAWKDGKRHGIGTQVFDSDTRYEGRWDNGLQHGTGKFFDLKRGTVYEGQWQGGNHHGPGLMRNGDGSKERMLYSHGMLLPQEQLPSPRGTLSPRKPLSPRP
mmetsp:Transcript_86683/g.245809  ORF Transcript_86683/g.245809 Transcript_86683/m.245809 type:complete len:219 (+) Transcript_86683:62-718(+)